MINVNPDWRTWDPIAQAILRASAKLYYGGDIDAAAKAGVEAARRVEIGPTAFEAEAEVQLGATKGTKHTK